MKMVQIAIGLLMALTVAVHADTFGTGDNAFNIDFVTISGSTNPTSGIPAGFDFTFTGVAKDYRMGTYEITNDQWNKFKVAYGAVTGSPSNAYDQNPYYTGTDVPTNNVSWYEAAQFVNYLNTSTGHQIAYKFTGTQGQSSYTMAPWVSTDNGYNASNPYRNSNAFYFMPTENEWVKAAYWNGTSIQAYATKAGQSLTQGNGTNGTGWNYYTNKYATDPYGPWAVGSGSQELNGTYDMMGNVCEWMESPCYSGDYLSGSFRGLRGGSYGDYGDYYPVSSSRSGFPPDSEYGDRFGFRIASIPEPCMLLLLGVGGMLIRKR